MNLVASAGESRLIHCQPRNQNHLMTAYRRRKCRPNKAFTPHPAVVLGWAYKNARSRQSSLFVVAQIQRHIDDHILLTANHPAFAQLNENIHRA